MSHPRGFLRTRRLQITAAIGLAAAVTAAVIVAVPGGAAAPATPPYEPLPNPPVVGSLKFFNAAGTEIFGGKVDDAPFASYVQSSTPGRSGDNKATLFGYLPKNGVSYDAWSGQALTASPRYPNASAPGALATSTLPVVTVSEFDYKLTDLVAAFPNSATDAYQGLYQLRVKTSGPGIGLNTSYSVADIKVSGSTWSVVYPTS